ncbi:IS30 family transposase [Oenococcus alcoholitolerans]|uniref:IS30 family transposase n=1 Tax=Oenococcus alcoholitolerans TaxID=931074 RepID=UPI003F71E301
MTNIKRTISKAYQQLSNFDRVRIETLLNQGFSQARIARELNRSRSTISREITRGSVLQRIPGHKVALIYFADTAAYLHAQRRERCRPKTMLEKNPEFYAACAAAIKQRPRVHSVDSFVHTFKREHADEVVPSTPTVYRDIEAGRFELRTHDLPRKPSLRIKRSHSHTRTNKTKLGTSIDERPIEVQDRRQGGHWEGDLVKGKRVDSEPALLVLTERTSRFEIIIKLANYKASTCKVGLQSIIDDYGAEYFTTITFDHGSEFAQLDSVEGTDVYFAHPYSPWERGTNENQNGLLREFIPKGRSLHHYDIIDIQSFQDALNSRPRRILGYRSAAELMPGL